MALYDGPAVVYADEASYPVTAHLRSGTDAERLGPEDPGTVRSQWHGTLEVADSEAAGSMYHASRLILRVEDGARGDFVAVGADLNAGVLDILGVGGAPFGE